MSFCNKCPYVGQEEGQCTFTGSCIIRNYNLHDTSSAFRASAVVVTPAKVVAEKTAAGTYFNQFQRGNGCILSEEVSSRTR